MAYAKKVQQNPNNVTQQLMTDYKQRGHINMDSTTKRLLASVPKEQRAVWKRVMLAAQRHKDDFKHHSALKQVRMSDGHKVELMVDTRFLK